MTGPHVGIPSGEETAEKSKEDRGREGVRDTSIISLPIGPVLCTAPLSVQGLGGDWVSSHPPL